MNGTSKNKTIAKNTITLYLRMFVIMAIGIYTSRVVLSTLGIEDYGVYNVVGGFVSMLAYIKTGFVSAAQRFLSFALGKNDMAQMKKVFATSVSVYYLLSILLLIISETIGLWYINNHLVVSPERLDAAIWVFQFSVMAFIVEMIGIPYNATIIAHEAMNVFAYISVLESVLKLVIVYLIVLATFDKLIFYAFLMLMVSVIVRMCYVMYCKKNYEETRTKLSIDFTLLKEMYAFAGWTAVGTLGFSFKDQFVNLVLNSFCGPTVNAARGIAMQVSGIVNQFSSNFLVAVSPQITKSYANADIDYCRKLVMISSKLTCFLMTIIVIPLSVNLDPWLRLWLVEYPDTTFYFVQIILYATLFGTMASPFTVAIQATGKVRDFQLGVAVIFLLELPLAYLLLKIGYAPYYAVTPTIITQLIGVLFRFYILKREVEGYSFARFIFDVLLKSILVVVITVPCANYLIPFKAPNFAELLVNTILAGVLTAGIIYVIGINSTERTLVIQYVKQSVKRF